MAGRVYRGRTLVLCAFSGPSSFLCFFIYSSVCVCFFFRFRRRKETWFLGIRCARFGPVALSTEGVRMRIRTERLPL